VSISRISKSVVENTLKAVNPNPMTKANNEKSGNSNGSKEEIKSENI
jgi:hypothetical protein